MEEAEVHKRSQKQAPTGYRLNEIVHFSYPVRHVKIDALVNKKPDASLEGVYNIILRAINMGMNTQDELFSFLGLSDTDEFISRELYLLREKGLLDLVSNKWIITDEGIQFIEGKTFFRLEVKEEFEFLVDGMSGEILSYEENCVEKNSLPKRLEALIDFPKSSPELIRVRKQELADVYKKEKEGKEYLISYNENEIKNDYNSWINFWLIEYTPIKRNTNESPKIEVRVDSTLKLNRKFTSVFNNAYRFYIYQLTNSDRASYEKIADDLKHENVVSEDVIEQTSENEEFKTLSIWETKQHFINALKTVKNRILIESPWIKRATQEYIPYFEKNLQLGKQIVILYGIEQNDEHDFSTIKQLEKLKENYQDKLHLVHLPSHLMDRGGSKTGTHRKLVIKDEDYYISGSFNFLSFGKNDKQLVANEESHIIYRNADKRWISVLEEYSLKIESVVKQSNTTTIECSENNNKQKPLKAKSRKEGVSKKNNQKKDFTLGEKLQGRIKVVKDYGVFVSFDGYPDALLHKNKMYKSINKGYLKSVNESFLKDVFRVNTPISVIIHSFSSNKPELALDFEALANSNIIQKLI